MPRAIFATVCVNGEPQVPPMDSGDGYRLHYMDGTVLKGGFWVIGEAPKPFSILVEIDAADEVLDMIANDPKYLFVEDVIEVQVISANEKDMGTILHTATLEEVEEFITTFPKRRREA